MELVEHVGIVHTLEFGYDFWWVVAHSLTALQDLELLILLVKVIVPNLLHHV